MFIVAFFAYKQTARKQFVVFAQLCFNQNWYKLFRRVAIRQVPLLLLCQ